MATPTFFLLVDAIPYDLAREFWAEGALPGFAEPRPLVSVFPSLTDVAVPSLLREAFPARPPGYEARYFHPPSGEVRGGLGDPESEVAVAPFRARPRGALAQAAIYLLQGRLAYAQIRWITHRFEREGGPWLGYLSATDGVAHFGGRPALAAAFRDIAGALQQARLEHQRRGGELPGVVMCSDHGMAFGPLDHLLEQDLARRLEAAGFRVGERGTEGVVLTPLGEVSAGAVHAHPTRACEVARVLAEAPGVDVAFAAVETDGFRAFAQREAPCSARVRWRDDVYRYEPEAGDPLDYVPVFAALERAGALDGGWVRDRDLFAASWSHRYPDALARVRHALTDLVQYPAPVLFSMAESWTFGPALTHAGAQLLGGQRGTHGALLAAQSLGFAAVSENGGDPWRGARALRPEDVFRPWLDLVRAGSAETS